MSTFYQEYDYRLSSYNYGTEILGGFAFPITEPILNSKRIISQRDLNVSQRIPGLEPFLLGFSTPLVNRTINQIGDSMEEKTHYVENSFHTTTIDFNKYERRNVLCGNYNESDKLFYLYSVNELGSQKKIYEHILEHHEGERKVEMPEICLKRRDKIKEINEKCAISIYESLNPIIEMSMYENDNGQNKIWLRNTKSLDLFDCKSREAKKIYKGYVKVLNQIPYMPDEICFTDSSGFAWYGEIESANYMRMKFNDPLINLVTTDSPRTFYGSNNTCVYEFDYRECSNAQDNIVIQESNLLSDCSSNGYDESHVDGKSLFSIKFLISPPEHRNNLILVTNRFYALFDNRYLSKPILRLPHNIYDGGDYVHFSQKGIKFNPSSNSDINGKLYMIYNLSKNVEPGVWYTGLFHNEKENIFSSTNITSELPKYENIVKYFSNKIPRDLRHYHSKLDNLTYGVYARSVCHITRDDNSEKGFIFRSNSDGSIWYDVIALNAHNLSYDEVNATTINTCNKFWNNQSVLMVKHYVDCVRFEKTQAVNTLWNCLFYGFSNKLKKDKPPFNQVTLKLPELSEIKSKPLTLGITKNIKEKTNLDGLVKLIKEMPEEYELSNIVLKNMNLPAKNN
ncbi:Hypothetical protein SRAE_2000234700 [Strongyloides ratti]|uniref:Uncharacterized protein n=1 Tax=Strongyloides ratti TaxID=34506 RepID=A0A090LD58_STRRB|nr:Hypothetical protein SRAE_2000234700 [Strongyloides ratti]CEF67686.1 Hypothetical protein SRAE_2000234700 [Strongyloides ratti]